MPPIALLAQVLRVDRALGSAALASSDAVKKLGFYKGELETWAETVERGVREGMDLNGVWEMLREQDPILRLSAEGDDSRRRTAIPNIIGLVEYTKWKLKEEAAKSS